MNLLFLGSAPSSLKLLTCSMRVFFYISECEVVTSNQQVSYGPDFFYAKDLIV